MKIAIMQPYLFPYLGYFQLIKAVDKFVIYDDVNYINKGWINRNQILLGDKAHMFTIPLKEASQNKVICEISLSMESSWKSKLLKTINQSYKKAPMSKDVYPLIESILLYDETNLASFIRHSLFKLCEYMKISTLIVASSSIYNNQELKGQSRILDICKKENATYYINPPNGRDLYNPTQFLNHNINLKFLNYKNVNYNQNLGGNFIPFLSIIDVLMFNDDNSLEELLNNYDLIS